MLGVDEGLLEAAHGRTTDVERTHGELRSRFTNGLGGDDADGGTDLPSPAVAR
jgi:hypothetical protein